MVSWGQIFGYKNSRNRNPCFIFIIFITNLFVSIIEVIDCLPLSRQRRDMIDDSVQRYLMRYGYLPMSDMETGNLRTEKQLREAVKVMQRFGHIPQTGRMDAATRALLRRPRCSLPDVMPEEYPSNGRNDNTISSRVRRFVKQGSSWDNLNLTWGVRSFPDRLRDRTGDQRHMSKWEVQREFRLATEVWARVSRLDFRELENRFEEADIIIDFREGYHGDGYPFDGPGRTLAHAFYPGEGIGGDMHFDTEEPWVQHKDANRTYEDISLFITAAHELGHALGLYHSDVEGSLMSPYLISFPPDFQLPDDDRRAIQEIYGVADDWRPTTRSGTVPQETLPTESEPVRPTRRPRPRRPTSGSTEKPDTCDTDYDAISIIRREIYIFKDKYFWRVDGKGKPRPNYPAEIHRFWQMLPKNLTKVDAVYERPHDGNIVFFIGRRYYICHGNNELIETGPLRRFGLPKDLNKIDAAFVWGHNGKTYFFADTMYWRFEEGNISHVELDYPRDMVMWRGVPYNIDAAFKYNGTTYFFKGKQFYEFDDLRMKVTPRSPLLSAPFWFNCPNRFENPYYTGTEQRVSSGSRFSPEGGHNLVLLILLSNALWTSLFIKLH
ncbi:UNVERIFIED_CONTAM: hypothetical protein RMT77_014670 [Armadillidium vulgare]